MSEKRVNIRITASTSDFDKAIKNAQKQIEKLADTIDDIGNGKFGDKLEKQLESVTDAAKKMQKQLEEMQESLDDMNKSKVDKLEKKLDDVSDSAEDLNDELEDTADTLEDLNKTKVDKLEKQFEETKKTAETLDNKIEDVIDSLKDMDDLDVDNVTKSFEDVIDANQDLKRRIDELLDNFDELDSQDLNRLENEFEQVEASIRGLGDEIRKTTDDLNRYIEDITNETNDLDKAIDDIDGEGFNRIKETVQELDEYIDEITDSTKDFNKEAGELDTSGIDRYADAMKDITGADGSINIDGDSSNKGNKDGLLDNVSDNLMSGAVAGNMMANSLDKVVDRLDDVTDKMEHLQDVADDDIDKSIDELGEEYRDAQSSLEKLTEEYDELIKKQKELDDNKADMESRNNQYKQEIQPLLDTYEKIQKEMDKKKKEFADIYKQQEEDIRDYTQAMEELEQKTLENNKAIEKQEQVLDDVGKAYDDATKKWGQYFDAMEDMEDSYQKLFIAAQKAREAGDNDFADSLGKQWQRVAKALTETKEEYDKLEKAMINADAVYSKESDKLDALKEEQKNLREAAKILEQMNKALSEQQGKIDQKAKEFENLEKRAEGVAEAVKKFKDVDITQDEELEKLKKEMQETEEAAEALADDIDDISNKMAELNKVAQGHADEFDKQYKAYEKLSKRVKAYLEDEEKSILLREKVAKSFKQVADSMEGVYADSSMLNNADLVNKTLKEAAEYVKDLNLVSTENLQADLKRLGEVLEDKTEKIKRFKELNKEFGSDASNQAYGIEKQAQSIRDWANSTDFAIEAADKLTNAWGDLSAAGEDHLKIRERSKYIEDFGKSLEENVAHIRNYYHELGTLDEIYEECTDKQRAIIDDYRIWEKNKDSLLEYNRAITEYLRTVKDTGGQIDDKFLNSLGKFDPQKFIDNYEKMGASSVVLSKQINAVRIELLESVNAYKENAEAMKENAKAAVEAAESNLKIAKNNQKAAESQEEYLEATEKVVKAQKELADAKSKLDNFDRDNLKNLSDQIKEYNKLAEAMRKIGMAAKDIEKVDVSKLDKSLASALNKLETFSDDIPKTFGDIKEDIAAVFSDMDSLDFGDAFDGLKEIGAGVLAKIPGWAKAAALAIGALAKALKECAEAGINQFNEGMNTVGEALSGLVGIARDVGQEIFDAFENITGMQLDFSSMIEVPVNFEAQMARVKSIGELTEEEFKRMEDLAVQLGATTRYGATEVAEAMEYMGQAGWGADEIEKSIESVLHLATVADMGLDKATETVTDVINAFKNAGDNSLTADDAGRVADMLNVAAVKTSTSIEELKSAFTNVAPIAGSFKMNLEDVTAALGLMGDQGVKGAKAGTALKNLIANMNNPTEKRLAVMKKYNLLGARQAIVNGDLLGGIKQMKQALDGLSDSERNQIIEIVAGKEALSGVSALLNTNIDSINELEAAMSDCSGSAKEMAEGFDKTLKGALLDLSGSIESNLIKVYQKLEESTTSVVNELTKFFNILGGFEQSSSGLTGIAGAFEYLEEVSQGWGDAIATGLSNAIASLDNFINGGALDSLLQAGTNIINGIADGIQTAADNGTLDSAISGAIKRIATWFSENLDTIVEVGKEVIDAISNGISENGDEIGEVIKEVIEMQTEIDKAVAHEKWKLIGENLVTFILEGIWSKITVFWSGLTGFLESGISEAFGSVADWITTGVSSFFFDPVTWLGTKIGEWLKDAIIAVVKDVFNVDISDWSGWAEPKEDKKKDSKKKDNKKKSSTSSSSKSTGKTPDTSSITDKSPIDLINSELSAGKVKTDTTAAEIGQGISDNITKKLETMDATQLKALNEEMLSLQTTVASLANGMATAFATIQNSARTSFMGLTNIVRNQMINCTNIVRNQAINWYNIIANQTTNARNIFTQKFMSMAAVARTQMVNVSNIIRNQAVSWYNVINNQITKARNAFTSQMISMAKVASTQMGKVSSTIKNAMTSVGKNIGDGVSSGLNKSSSSVSNSSNNFKNTLVNKFKSAFGIHSPSTVMRDEVGTYLALGIEEGIVNGATNINSAVNDTVNSINSRMSGMNNSNLISVDTAGIQAATVSMTALSMTISKMSLQVKGLVETFTELHMTIRSTLLTMKNMVSSIRSVTAQMSSSRSMSLNVNRTVSTNYADALYAANNASTLSLGGNMSALSSGASYAMSTGGGSSFGGSSIGSNVTLEIPVMLDGRELARASAKYIDGEIKTMNKRENRKRGAK